MLPDHLGVSIKTGLWADRVRETGPLTGRMVASVVEGLASIREEEEEEEQEEQEQLEEESKEG